MGRIQRKKSPAAKKKKKQKAAQEVSGGPGAEKKGGAGKKLSVVESTSRGWGKIQASAAKKQAPAAGSAPGKPQENFLTRAKQFLREVKVELKKVTWPSRKQTVGSTVVVIVLVMIISLFLGLVDFGLSGLIRAILQ